MKMEPFFQDEGCYCFSIMFRSLKNSRLENCFFIVHFNYFEEFFPWYFSNLALVLECQRNPVLLLSPIWTLQFNLTQKSQHKPNFGAYNISKAEMLKQYVNYTSKNRSCSQFCNAYKQTKVYSVYYDIGICLIKDQGRSENRCLGEWSFDC